MSSSVAAFCGKFVAKISAAKASLKARKERKIANDTPAVPSKDFFCKALPPEMWGEISRHIELPSYSRPFAAYATPQGTLGDHRAMAEAVHGYWQVSRSYNPEIVDRMASTQAKRFLQLKVDGLDYDVRQLLLHAKALHLHGAMRPPSVERVQRLNYLLVNLPQLLRLDLSWNQLGDAFLDQIQLDRLPLLQELNLGHNLISGPSRRLASLVNLPDLRILQLPNNRLRGAECDSIRELTQLQELNLRMNNLGRSRWQSFGLEHFTNLEVLNLGSNALRDDDVRQLAAETQDLTQLKIIHLGVHRLSRELERSLPQLFPHAVLVRANAKVR